MFKQNYLQLFFVCCLTFLCLPSYGQNTVNVEPGDDISAALDEAGPGGTVIFAPGEYKVVATNSGGRDAIAISPDLAGIRLIGAGSGFDPSTSTIINGESGFIESGLDIDASDVHVEGFTFYKIWDEGAVIGEGFENIEIKDCWFVRIRNGLESSSSSGVTDNFATAFEQPRAVRFINCVFARGGDDGTDLTGTSQYVFINCDFYDWGSDLMENEDDTLMLMQNCIFHAGTRSDDLDAGSGVIETWNCVFWDPGQTPGENGIQFANVIEFESLYDDPLYVNVGPAVLDFELDFHLKADSPALTAGVDKNGDPTFAGSQGPAQQ
jgi:hypothetical protein